MYTFVRLKNTWKDMNIEYPWALKATSVQDILDHNNIYMRSTIEDGIEDALEKGNKHPHTRWRSVVDVLSSINGKNWIDTSAELERNAVTGKMIALTKFGCIYLNSNGSYSVPSEHMLEIENADRETLSYPEENNFTEKDIKISRWPEGKHYYAKVGNIDVREADGTLKWNTYERAYEVSVAFLNSRKR